MRFSRRALLAALLGLAAAPALAQGLGFGLGMHDVVVRAGGGGAPPLDGFTAPSAAYSFRKLRSAYAGPAVKLQRVDTTTQDIGFTAAGDFDIAAAAAFCMTACTVNTWYDQSGLGRHAVQAVAANQPAYIAACAGARPCFQITTATQILTTAATITPATGVVSLSAVGSRAVGTGSCNFNFQGNPGANRMLAFNAAANQWVLAATSGSIAPAAADAAWHTGQGVINGAASVLNIDGVETTGTVTGSTVAGTSSVYGSASTTCNFAEKIVWDAYVLTPAERTALAANQRSYWGTP